MIKAVLRGATALVAGSFLGCSVAWAQQADAVVEVEAEIAVPAMAAADIPFENCLINPWELVEVASPVVGVLSHIRVKKGDEVTEGQTLAELRQDVEKSQLDLALTRANFSKRKLDRTASLQERNFVSEQEVDQLRTEYRVAQLEAAEARAQLRLRTIAAPINGIVVARHLSKGELTRDEPIMTLAQMDPLKVEVVVDSSYMPALAVGQTAKIFPQAPASGEFEAEIIQIDQLIDAASGTIGLTLSLPNPDKSLPAGLACNIIFQ